MSDASNPMQDYARLLLRQHALDPRGEIDSPELDAICEEMEGPWQRMNGSQRRLMRGLSQDLYALADGRRGVQMSNEAMEEWNRRREAARQADDLVLRLDHWRQPYPIGTIAGFIPLQQGHCWERIGLLEVAFLFFQDAGKFLPASRNAALNCLEILGRDREAIAVGMSILSDARSSRLDCYFAASMLFFLARRSDSAEAWPILAALATKLSQVFETEKKNPLFVRGDFSLEGASARALAFALIALDRHDEARAVCDDVLSRYPNDWRLLLARGLVNLQSNLSAAQSDFEQAVALGAQNGLPYAAMALFRCLEGRYTDVLSLSAQAIVFPYTPLETQGYLHELRGIAQAELKDPLAKVMEAFALALKLNPRNADRIKHNRRVALKKLAASSTFQLNESWSLPQAMDYVPQFKEGLLNEMFSSGRHDRREGYPEPMAPLAL